MWCFIYGMQNHWMKIANLCESAWTRCVYNKCFRLSKGATDWVRYTNRRRKNNCQPREMNCMVNLLSVTFNKNTQISMLDNPNQKKLNKNKYQWKIFNLMQCTYTFTKHHNNENVFMPLSVSFLVYVFRCSFQHTHTHTFV